MGYDVSMIDGHIDEPKESSDVDIMMALECIAGFDHDICFNDKCHYYSNDEMFPCSDAKIAQDALDLINRLKTDNELKRIKIEKLQHELDTLKSRK